MVRDFTVSSLNASITETWLFLPFPPNYPTHEYRMNRFVDKSRLLPSASTYPYRPTPSRSFPITARSTSGTR